VAKLSIEQGINCFVSNDMSTALEHFIRAARMSQHAIDQWYAQMNSLFCLENLGLPLERQYERAKTAGMKVDARTSGAPLRDFERRRDFWFGRLSCVFADDEQKAAFSCYQKLWMLSLPWHAFYRADALTLNLFETVVQTGGDFHLNQYRVRTLQGIAHPDDSTCMPMSELVLRIYLWTWRWLIQPAKFDLSRVVDCFSRPSLSQELDSLGPHDAMMLRNALQWMAIFDGQQGHKLDQWATSLTRGFDASSPVLQMEHLLIRSMQARRNDHSSQRKDTRRLIEGIQLGSDVLFARMLDAVDHADIQELLLREAPWLKRFMGTLAALGNGGKNHGQKDHEHVRVDLLSESIFLSGRAIVSRSLCLGLFVLKSHGSLSRSDFLYMVWNIAHYEPTDHDAKILNLLARMRAVVNIRFGVKDSQVFAQGSWDNVVFVGDLEHSFEVNHAKLDRLHHTLQRPKIIATRRGHQALAQLLSFVNNHPKRPLTRQNIQAIWGLSRSSTFRMLDRLIDEGKIHPRGQGPARYYELDIKQENV
jgi:hypothetical protein